MAFRIYQTLSGIPGSTIEFLVEVGKFAHGRGRDRIELEDLRKIYNGTLGSHRVGSRNPFTETIPENWLPVPPGHWFQDEGPGHGRK